MAWSRKRALPSLSVKRMTWVKLLLMARPLPVTLQVTLQVTLPVTLQVTLQVTLRVTL